MSDMTKEPYWQRRESGKMCCIKCGQFSSTRYCSSCTQVHMAELPLLARIGALERENLELKLEITALRSKSTPNAG